MSNNGNWFDAFGTAEAHPNSGLVAVDGYRPETLHPDQVPILEKAASYGAVGVFFEAARNDRAPIPQALVFISNDNLDDKADKSFAELHRRLWSWGRVPLLYRRTAGAIQLFRCAHKPDFLSEDGRTICQPFKTLNTLSAISSDPWWNVSRLLNGTFWDDPAICKSMLSADKAAHHCLLAAVKGLNDELNAEGILKKHLRRKLLILSLLIAYLEERGAFSADYFSEFTNGASRFFQVLADGQGLVALLLNLEERFNGNVFSLSEVDRESLRTSGQLKRFASLVEGRQQRGGQRTLWQLYSFADLPIELISHIYQMFVDDTDTSVYTPPFLVRLMLDEVLNKSRLDKLIQNDEVILDPACGSGVFLVEAYKRLVLHWRSTNGWKRPSISVLKSLLKKVCGVDLESGAIELAAFSLCLALCDALEPEAIRSSIKLFPPLISRTLHSSCFFEAIENMLLKERVGVVIGNPPFKSQLSTESARRSFERYSAEHGMLPDKQIGYLFLHESAQVLADSGVLCMLQQYNFLYNQQSRDFRQNFIKTMDVREILDFISVRGLFKKGDADTKVVVVVAEAAPPPANRKILHATFRRTGRIDGQLGFDIDYYDLHWLPRQLVLEDDGVWRSDLMGGGRTLKLANRLREFQTLEVFAKARDWDYGEGFIEAQKGKSNPADHIIGKPLLRSKGLTKNGIDESAIETAPDKSYEGPRSKSRFTPPMLLIHEHMDLAHDVWTKSYLTYTQQIVGFCAPESDLSLLRKIQRWLSRNDRSIQAYLTLISPRLFTQKSTSVQADDIFSIPFRAHGDLDLSVNEKLLIDDIIDYQRDLVRLGHKSSALMKSADEALPDFAKVFKCQINAIYKKTPLTSLVPYSWPGVICQPFVFGNGRVDWRGADELKSKLREILHDQRSPSLEVTRIARIYDGDFLFLVKPDRLRYWLRSFALRDADETLADLRIQGF